MYDVMCHMCDVKPVDELKQTLTLEWRRLSQRFINQSIAEWRQRLRAVVDNDGAHIEHLFK